MKCRRLASLVACLVLASPIPAQQAIDISIEGGKQDLENVPVCVPLSVPAELFDYRYAQVSGGGLQLQGQLTKPGILTEGVPVSGQGLVRRDLHVVLPNLKKGQSPTLTAKLLKADNAPDTTGFFWMDHKGEYAELFFDVLSGVK